MPLLRCLAVGTAATVATTATVVRLAPVLPAPAHGLDEVLVRGCAAVALVAALGLWLGTVVTLVAALRGREARGVPAPLRRTVLAVCGLALAGAVAAGTAHADRARPPAAPATSVAGLPLPDLPTSQRPAPYQRVEVEPGDSLWSIAAHRLGPGADAAAVDAEWRRIYAANRALIGPDPDLIQPAQRLRMPVSEVHP